MIGYFSLARETFDINYAKKKFNEIKKIIDDLNDFTMGFDTLITNDFLFSQAVKFFNKNKCSKYIVIQTTFTDTKFILNFVKRFKKPIHFIAFKEPRTGGRLRLNSLCGVNLGMHALIKKNQNPCFTMHIKDRSKTKKEIKKFFNFKNFNKKTSFLKRINTKKISGIQSINFNKQKLGLIGKKPDGFDTCDYDQLEIKNKLNVSIKKFNLVELFNISKNVSSKQIQETKKIINQNLKNTDKLNLKELNKSISLFHGLENIKNKENIDAFAIRCWPEMFTEYGCASCGPMAMMNEKKISCACEADVLGSISCNILNQINNKPSLLVDIVDVDPTDNSTVFWHCGLAPISMAEKNTASATIHSNRRKPLLHNFSFKPGKITVFRVSKAQNKFKFFLMRGKILKKKNSFSGTSGVIRLGRNTQEKIEQMFLSGLEHHVAFTYGDVYEDILKLSKKLKIPAYTL